jgi:hypothetical protein
MALLPKLAAYLFAVDRGEREFVTDPNHSSAAA